MSQTKQTTALCSKPRPLSLLLYLPQSLRVLLEKLNAFGGHDVGVRAQEEVLHPTHVTVCADSLAAIAERVGGTGLVFLGLALHEELQRFILQTRYHLRRNAMVHHLEQTNLLAGLHHHCLGVGV